MKNDKNEVYLIMAGLKFSKSEIGSACNNKKNTIPAVLLIAFSVILGVVIAYFKGNGGSSGVGRMGLTGFDAAIVQLGSLLIGTFLSAFIMVYVIRVFKVKPSYDGILIVYGSAIIWIILKSVFGLILSPNFALLGVAFWLAFNFSVLFGLAGYTKIKIWQSFLSIVLTFAVVFVIMIPYGMIVKAIFT